MKTIAGIIILYNILFIDSKTKETLPGVKVETEQHTYYSGMDGSVDIPKNEKIINVSYLSYTDVSKDFTCKTDTVIKLKSR